MLFGLAWQLPSWEKLSLLSSQSLSCLFNWKSKFPRLGIQCIIVCLTLFVTKHCITVLYKGHLKFLTIFVEFIFCLYPPPNLFSSVILTPVKNKSRLTGQAQCNQCPLSCRMTLQILKLYSQFFSTQQTRSVGRSAYDKSDSRTNTRTHKFRMILMPLMTAPVPRSRCYSSMPIVRSLSRSDTGLNRKSVFHVSRKILSIFRVRTFCVRAREHACAAVAQKLFCPNGEWRHETPVVAFYRRSKDERMGRADALLATARSRKVRYRAIAKSNVSNQILNSCGN